jgi:prolyl-tRNA synthetase
MKQANQKPAGRESKEQTAGITIKKESDFSEWYNQVVEKAELAEHAPIHGFMTVRPNGYALWEAIQASFEANYLKPKGVRNAYFPLLIPESFFKKEQEHAEGFSPDVAWLEKKEEGSERLALRPTSETIMYDTYSRWVRSWRDLPLRINQWCNIIRWEIKMTKLFLRTREFLWQEGHCVYETQKEAVDEALEVLEAYKKLDEELLAIPVILGEKTEKERFPGAMNTFTVEALMPDGKALQMGTSHNLGQNFSKAFGISFLNKQGSQEFAFQTSWGFSTRLIGGLVMTHSDNKGLVLPPKVAFNKIVIVPILFEQSKEKVLKKAREIEKSLKEFNPLLDDREAFSPGFKYSEWELKGIPLRIEIGPKDLEKEQAVIAVRDSGEKKPVKIKGLKKEILLMLEAMQKRLYGKAKKFLDESIAEVSTMQEFKKAIEAKKLVLMHFCETAECEDNIKAETTAGSRCITFNQKPSQGKCIRCGKPSKRKTLFGKSY